MTYKEKKELLKSFAKIEGRLRDLEGELEVSCSRGIGVNLSLGGHGKGGEGPNKVENTVEWMERQTLLIDRERDELEAVRFKILEAVKRLPDITERRVIHLKYIGKAAGKYHKRVPLWKIANELGYSADRINHIHGAAIRHLKF